MVNCKPFFVASFSFADRFRCSTEFSLNMANVCSPIFFSIDVYNEFHISIFSCTWSHTHSTRRRRPRTLTASFFYVQLDDCQISCNFSILLPGHCSLFTLPRHCFAIKLNIFHLILFFYLSLLFFFSTFYCFLLHVLCALAERHTRICLNVQSLTSFQWCDTRMKTTTMKKKTNRCQYLIDGNWN